MRENDDRYRGVRSCRGHGIQVRRFNLVADKLSIRLDRIQIVHAKHTGKDFEDRSSPKPKLYDRNGPRDVM